jgi:O-antigen/teichoic acid export membrane protein
MVWNWGGMAVGMAVGFLVAPFLVHQLGQTNYGLWILISSFTNYFGLLDLGIRASVGRNIALQLAQGDHAAINRTLTTALGILSLAGCLALVATLVLVPVFPHLFDIPPDQYSAARLALLLVGLNLALWLPLNVFDATLWAHQRFDLLNAVDIPMYVLRALLTFYFIGNGYGLVALALINLLALAGGQAIKAVISFRLNANLDIGLRQLSRSAARCLFGYGLWYFLLSLTRMMTNQISPILIGALLGVRLVALYSIASRLLSYAAAMLGACTGVLTPVATVLHAEDRREEQQKLLLTGGRYCLAIALFVATLFTLLGAPLVTLWMGEGLRGAAWLLLILALGELLPMSQHATSSTILALGRHRFMACLGLVENAVAISLGVLLSRSYGLPGVCLAFAVTGAVCRGLIQAVYGCRLLEVPLRLYFTQGMLPPLLAAIPPALLLGVLVSWREPKTWLELAVFGAVYGLAFAASVGFVVAPPALRVALNEYFTLSKRAVGRLTRGLLGAR